MSSQVILDSSKSEEIMPDKCKECQFINKHDKKVCLLDFNYGNCPFWLKENIKKPLINKGGNYE